MISHSLTLSPELTPEERADFITAIYVQRSIVATADDTLPDDLATMLAAILIARDRSQ